MFDVIGRNYESWEAFSLWRRAESRVSDASVSHSHLDTRVPIVSFCSVLVLVLSLCLVVPWYPDLLLLLHCVFNRRKFK